MASGDSLIQLFPANDMPPNWLWVAYTSGSTEPAVGDQIFGDTSAANAFLEYYIQLTGTWGAGTSAGFFLMSNWNASDWTSGENWTAGSDAGSNHGTFTGIPAENWATFDTINSIHVLDFDDTVNEVALFAGILPAHYDGGGLTVTAVQTMAAATGDVSCAGFFRSFTDDVDNLLHTSFNAWGTRKDNAAIDAPTVIGELTYDDITFTSGAEMDGLVAGEAFHFLWMRDAQDGTNDDMAGDASLLALQIKET